MRRVAITVSIVLRAATGSHDVYLHVTCVHIPVRASAPHNSRSARLSIQPDAGRHGETGMSASAPRLVSARRQVGVRGNGGSSYQRQITGESNVVYPSCLIRWTGECGRLRQKEVSDNSRAKHYRAAQQASQFRRARNNEASHLQTLPLFVSSIAQLLRAARSLAGKASLYLHANVQTQCVFIRSDRY